MEDNGINIIQQELELVIKDIKDLYVSSGRKVTGKFGDSLKATSTENKGILEGQTYIAGRSAGKLPPIQDILEWVDNRGIADKGSKERVGISWAIAKSIAKKGTKNSPNKDLYSQIITPQRIDTIIKKINKFHADKFVEVIQLELGKLDKKL